MFFKKGLFCESVENEAKQLVVKNKVLKGSQCTLTLEKIFSRELVKDLLALFFRTSSLNLPLLVAFSGIVLFEKVYRKKNT